MRVRRISRAAAGVAAASAALLVGTLSGTASAATPADNYGTCGQVMGQLCVWQDQFSGQRTEYTVSDLGTSCVTVPLGALADLNYSDSDFAFYPTSNCSGNPSLLASAGDYHSWLSYGSMYSFRLAS